MPASMLVFLLHALSFVLLMAAPATAMSLELIPFGGNVTVPGNFQELDAWIREHAAGGVMRLEAMIRNEPWIDNGKTALFCWKGVDIFVFLRGHVWKLSLIHI